MAAPERQTVLIIDDDERVRRALSQLLHWTGAWQVVGAAAEGAGALDLAEALHPQLVLLDLWLPDMIGLDLLPHLASLRPAPAVVVLTVETNAAFERHALRLGARGYIPKTTPPLEILATLKALG